MTNARPGQDPAPAGAAQLFALRRPLINGVGSVTQLFGANPANYSMYGLAGHEGLDYGTPEGTPVLAAHDGKVAISQIGNYGLHITVANERLSTVYAHLSQTRVQAGMTVMAGDVIGLSGNSGRTTGPHLHFGCKVAGVRNPAYQDFVDPVLLRKLNGDA
jgi:murein DD-endopeptidase MepM/ murein hydrolase activator NlpD